MLQNNPAAVSVCSLEHWSTGALELRTRFRIKWESMHGAAAPQEEGGESRNQWSEWHLGTRTRIRWECKNEGRKETELSNALCPPMSVCCRVLLAGSFGLAAPMIAVFGGTFDSRTTVKGGERR